MKILQTGVGLRDGIQSEAQLLPAASVSSVDATSFVAP